MKKMLSAMTVMSAMLIATPAFAYTWSGYNCQTPQPVHCATQQSVAVTAVHCYTAAPVAAVAQCHPVATPCHR